jgi:hypothetical protein
MKIGEHFRIKEGFVLQPDLAGQVGVLDDFGRPAGTYYKNRGHEIIPLIRFGDEKFLIVGVLPDEIEFVGTQP